MSNDYKPGDELGYLLSDEAARVRTLIDVLSLTLSNKRPAQAAYYARELGYEFARQGRFTTDTPAGAMIAVIGQNVNDHGEARVLAKLVWEGVRDYKLFHSEGVNGAV